MWCCSYSRWIVFAQAVVGVVATVTCPDDIVGSWPLLLKVIRQRRDCWIATVVLIGRYTCKTKKKVDIIKNSIIECVVKRCSKYIFYWVKKKDLFLGVLEYRRRYVTKTMKQV